MKKRKFCKIILLCISLILCFGLIGCDKNKPNAFDKDDIKEKKIVYEKTIEYVKEQLKCPSTAKFPDFDENYVRKCDNNKFYIKAYYDAENSYGAMVREKYDCQLKKEDGVYKKIYIDRID